MKVEELIEELQKVPPDLKVHAEDSMGRSRPIRGVRHTLIFGAPVVQILRKGGH